MITQDQSIRIKQYEFVIDWTDAPPEPTNIAIGYSIYLTKGVLWFRLK